VFPEHFRFTASIFSDVISKLTWVLKETIIQKLLVFERKILRRIFGPPKETKYGESKPVKNSIS
jgi:hypothetical protein